MSTNNKANRLIHEKSPYLLQHAYNPVNWFPWSDEAFQKAKSEDKPIFLSIAIADLYSKNLSLVSIKLLHPIQAYNTLSALGFFILSSYNK